MNQTNGQADSKAQRRTHEIDPCPRCGTDHGEQTFHRLVRPLRFGNGTFAWWTTCETTGEPVLADIPPEEGEA